LIFVISLNEGNNEDHLHIKYRLDTTPLIRSPRSRQAAFDLLILLALLGTALILAQWAYRAPRSAKLAIDALPVLLPIDGFHEVEHFADRPGIYRWSQASAYVKLPNPGGAVVLRVVLAGGPGRSAPVAVRAGTLATSFIVRPEPRSYMLTLPPADGERITVAFDAPTVSQNNRELGVVVGDLAISGGGAAPSRVLLALALATIGLYALVRQAGLRRLYAAGAVLLFQALAIAWQMAGLWNYALFGTLLSLVGGAGLAAVIIEQFWPSVPAPERHAILTRQDRLMITALIVLAFCVRLPWLTAADPVGDLELSARRMGFLYADGLAGAYRFDGDYMPLRLYWLWGFSRLVPSLGGSFDAPLAPATLLLIKLPGVLADLATVALLYVWCRRWRGAGGAALIAALYTFAPPVWMVVAWWGQVDAILLLPLLGMVTLLDRAGGRWSWICWAIALLIKTQAIIFAPLLYVATLRRHGSRGLLQGGALVALLLAIGCAPLVWDQQGPGLVQAYVGAVGRFPRVTNRAYNLWYLVTQGVSRSDLDPALGGLSFRQVGMLLIGCAALIVCLALFRRFDGPARAEGAAVMALSFFMLPTQIHERYLFFVLAFLALRLASDRWMLIPYLVLVTTATLNILGGLSGFNQLATAAIAASPLPPAIAIVNLLVLLFLIGHLIVTSWRVPETNLKNNRQGAKTPSII
jgi:Gpi18-like mannosyltransferase